MHQTLENSVRLIAACTRHAENFPHSDFGFLPAPDDGQFSPVRNLNARLTSNEPADPIVEIAR